MISNPWEPKSSLFHAWDEKPSIDFDLLRDVGFKPIVMFMVRRAEQRSFPHLAWNAARPAIRVLQADSVRMTIDLAEVRHVSL
jgi:hypothetical protein